MQQSAQEAILSVKFSSVRDCLEFHLRRTQVSLKICDVAKTANLPIILTDLRRQLEKSPTSRYMLHSTLLDQYHTACRSSQDPFRGSMSSHSRHSCGREMSRERGE